MARTKQTARKRSALMSWDYEEEEAHEEAPPEQGEDDGSGPSRQANIKGDGIRCDEDAGRNVGSEMSIEDLPIEVFEHIARTLSDVDEEGNGKGGLNVLRLINRRCQRVAESLATRLTFNRNARSFPTAALKRCKRIEHIRCFRLECLGGCPDGLKSLVIDNGDYIRADSQLKPLSACKELEELSIGHWESSVDFSYITDLSPLSNCTKLKKLILPRSLVTDITPLSSLPLLEELDLFKKGEVMGGSIVDITPLSQCKKLKFVELGGNGEIKDLSPLSQCPDLEVLDSTGFVNINNLSCFDKGFEKLRVFLLTRSPVDDLSPLSRLQNLVELNCCHINETTSLLPLARCRKLKVLVCSRSNSNENDLDELRAARPDLDISADLE